jgi:hypothetical protein
MQGTLRLTKYSIGVGDRFAHQAAAQLQACVLASRPGREVAPVWNKSNREHLLVGSNPAQTRAAAQEAVRRVGWAGTYHVDADHIGLATVERFIPHSDFFTIDVADFIGKPAAPEWGSGFVSRHAELLGRIELPGATQPLKTTEAAIRAFAEKYAAAVTQAREIYRAIARAKGEGTFITEVSMDETDRPQSPPELLVILAALADEQVPVQTIAPKFSGRFNKSVDYVGDAAAFEREFNEDLAVVAYAVRAYGLPQNLKLSIHSGSDKFSIYGPMRRGLERFDAGLHLKTAGTTWLEEVIGLAESGGAGLMAAQEIYERALGRVDELCAPYATVIDIDRARLPSASTVRGWTPEQFCSALRHEPSNPEFNANLRQLLHVGYKIAAEMGSRYTGALEACAEVIARNVTANLYERHLKPLYDWRR